MLPDPGQEADYAVAGSFLRPAPRPSDPTPHGPMSMPGGTLICLRDKFGENPPPCYKS